MRRGDPVPPEALLLARARALSCGPRPGSGPAPSGRQEGLEAQRAVTAMQASIELPQTQAKDTAATGAAVQSSSSGSRGSGRGGVSDMPATALPKPLPEEEGRPPGGPENEYAANFGYAVEALRADIPAVGVHDMGWMALGCLL